MDEKEVLKERFKSAITSAVKAISENFDIDTDYFFCLDYFFLASTQVLKDYEGLRK